MFRHGKVKKKDDWFDTKDDILRNRLKKPQQTTTPPKSGKRRQLPRIKVPTAVTFKVPRIRIPKTITIRFARPKFFTKLRSSKWLKDIWKFCVQQKIVVIPVMIFAVLLTGVLVTTSSSDKQQYADGQTASEVNKPKPEFEPVVSIEKQAKGGDLGMRYSPDKKTASVKDNYFEKTITLSQQQITKDQSKDPTTIEKAASSIAQAFALPITARKSVNSSAGILYYFDIPDSTMQRGVMVYKELLIFFVSDQQLDTDDWQQYLKSLSPVTK